MTPLILTTTENQALTEYLEKAKKYAAKSKTRNTVRAYQAAVSDKRSTERGQAQADRRRRFPAFGPWCQAHDAQSLPADPQTVVAYLVALVEGGASTSTLKTRVAAIGSAHRLAGAIDPTDSEDVRTIMAGITRDNAETQTAEGKAPVMLEDLRRMVAALPDTLAGKRDRAILLVGWAGAFRRSELVAVTVAHVRINGDLKITIPHSKTNQDGQAHEVKVLPAMEDKTICPLTAMRVYLDAAGINSGLVFRQIDRWGGLRDSGLTGQSVGLIVKAAAESAGIDPRQFGAHSLRSGFVTEATIAGVEDRDIMAVTGHKSPAMVRHYSQDAGLGAKRAIKAAFGEK